MSVESCFSKSIYLDPESGKQYPMWVSKETQEKIQSDKTFSLKLFNWAKTMHTNNSGNDEIFYLGEESFNILDVTKESRQINNDDNNNNDNDFDMREFISFNSTISKSTQNSNEAVQQSDCRCSTRQSKEKYSRKYNGSLALIRSYGFHYEEKNHPMKKKFFWNNIANDLISQKYNVNEKLCQTR
ncbi:uncharacterized protein LOC123270569 [Cotesia glomerata]|uniref:Uncharacterized protein n=1 Tax=Cotesia glomerata TaxID=32391 RepID=A0AAV7I2D5_COTGL|nr:uncharacterized protein LOC123270569 [Cotesia glomerata]KAH0552321.1 hypothetical protein KQX54_008707 [Cotesia glomerata]